MGICDDVDPNGGNGGLGYLIGEVEKYLNLDSLFFYFFLEDQVVWGWGFYNLLEDEIVMWNLPFLCLKDYAYEVSVPRYDATPLIHLVVGSLLACRIFVRF